MGVEGVGRGDRKGFALDFALDAVDAAALFFMAIEEKGEGEGEEEEEEV